MIKELTIGEVYSNETIFTALRVGNAGGIRLSLLEKSVSRVAIMVSVQDARITSENPYHDRLENGILTYTAAGKTGEQSLAGVNQRVIDKNNLIFPYTDLCPLPAGGIKQLGRNAGNILDSSSFSVTPRYVTRLPREDSSRLDF